MIFDFTMPLGKTYLDSETKKRTWMFLMTRYATLMPYHKVNSTKRRTETCFSIIFICIQLFFRLRFVCNIVASCCGQQPYSHNSVKSTACLVQRKCSKPDITPNAMLVRKCKVAMNNNVLTMRHKSFLAFKVQHLPSSCGQKLNRQQMVVM